MKRRSQPGRDVTSVNLLGGFELRRNGERVPLTPGAERLVAFLALRRVAVHRIFVAGTLWIDSGQEAANANLRTALWRLRRLSFTLVDSTPAQVRLGCDVVVDLHEISETARRISANTATCEDGELDQIVQAGDVLPDWYEDWVVIERERFRQARLHSLESLCHALTRQGRYHEAIEVGLTAVAGEPLRESAHRAVMNVHLAEGNRTEALRQYEFCRRLLGELGLDPCPETERLWRLCGSGDAAVTAVP